MKRLLTFAIGLSLLAGPAAAQEDLLTSCSTIQATADPSVPGGVPPEVNEQFQFLCGQVVSAMANVQPGVGIAFSGGAHTLGTATTIGRRLGLVPRISVTARLNGAFANVPDLLDGFDPTLGPDNQVPPMGTAVAPLIALQGDVVVGLFNGFSFGPAAGGLGAVDLLGSVSFVPKVDRIGLTEPIVNTGIGARIGILKQGLVMPGISVSGMYRTLLGDVEFGDLAADDPAEFTADLSTYSFRAGISKGFVMIDLAAGVGYDIYRSDVAFDWELVCPAGECLPGQDVTLSSDVVQGELKTAAWNVYGNVGMSVVILDIVGEVGYQKSTDIVDAEALAAAGLGEGQRPTAEALEGGRFFASLGVRLSF